MLEYHLSSPKIISVMALILTIATSSQGAAASTDGKYAVRGAGAASCQSVLEAVEVDDLETRTENVTRLTIWVGGYLTYVNRTLDGTFDAVPFASDKDILAIAVNRCEQLPESNFAQTLFETVQILASERVENVSEIVREGNDIALRKSIIERIQLRLIEQGFLKGATDGVLGPMSRRAISAFRASNDLPESPGLDIDTVLRILTIN